VSGLADKHIYRRVVERRIYPDGGSGSGFASRMTYSRPETSTTNTGYSSGNSGRPDLRKPRSRPKPSVTLFRFFAA